MKGLPADRLRLQRSGGSPESPRLANPAHVMRPWEDEKWSRDIIEVAGAFVPRPSRDFFLFLAFFWRAERQQPRQGWRVFRGRGDLPGSKRLVGLRAVCAVRHRLDPVARSSRASPWGTGGASKWLAKHRLDVVASINDCVEPVLLQLHPFRLITPRRTATAGDVAAP